MVIVLVKTQLSAMSDIYEISEISSSTASKVSNPVASFGQTYRNLLVICGHLRVACLQMTTTVLQILASITRALR